MLAVRQSQAQAYLRTLRLLTIEMFLKTSVSRTRWHHLAAIWNRFFLIASSIRFQIDCLRDQHGCVTLKVSCLTINVA